MEKGARWDPHDGARDRRGSLSERGPPLGDLSINLSAHRRPLELPFRIIRSPPPKPLVRIRAAGPERMHRPAQAAAPTVKRNGATEEEGERDER